MPSTNRMAKKRQSPKSDTISGVPAETAAPASSGQLAENSSQPLVGVIMGSASDWETMEHVATTLAKLGVPHETQVVSAHRTPDLLFEYASSAEKRGIEVIIAGAGGAAHLPGMTAAKTSLQCLAFPSSPRS